jgi:eight-cysteine-cluster-containing protein
MKKNFIFISLIIIILVILGIWYINNKDIFSPQKLTFISEVNYICDDDKIIKASFYEGEYIPVGSEEMPIPSGSVEIVLSDGRNFNLPQTISASGIRYANDDESLIFWSKGENAFILENDEETYKNCFAEKNCYVGGCSGELCTNNPEAISTCEFLAGMECLDTEMSCELIENECTWVLSKAAAECFMRIKEEQGNQVMETRIGHFFEKAMDVLNY